MKTRMVEAPTPPEARHLVETGLDEGAVVTLFGRCEVEYEGRASSYLGPGDRLVVLKPDGTLLVHTGEQRTPVNWQPPGCAHAVVVREESLVVTSTRETPDERIDIRFSAVDGATAYRMDDPEELELSGTEADLRDRIVDDPSLLEEGFEPRETERSTDVGSADLVGVDVEGRPVVVELKRRRVGPTAVSQLGRYVDALVREQREADGRTDVRGVLVAPSVTDGARELLAEEGLEFVSLAP